MQNSRKHLAYDPRLDTEPGAHPMDRAYWHETDNAALVAALFIDLREDQSVDWQRVAAAANDCEQQVDSEGVRVLWVVYPQSFATPT